MKKIKIYQISIIVLIALLFRANGMFYGFPFFLVGDEYSLVGGTLRMYELKTLFPVLHNKEAFQILIYPMLIPYLYFISYAPYIIFELINNSFSIDKIFISSLLENLHYFLFISRLTSVIISTITVIVIFFIAKLIFKNFYIALFCSLLVTFDWITVMTSHFARHWNLTTLIVWLGVFIAIKVNDKNNKKYYILAGILSGLGYGTSYVFGSMSLIPIFVSHLLKYKAKLSEYKKLSLTILIFLFFVIFFSYINPYLIERYIFTDVTSINIEKTFLKYFKSFVFYSKVLFYSNPSITILSICGFLSSLLIKNSRKISFFSFFSIFAYMFILSNIVTDEDRYIILVIPSLAILACYNLVLINFLKLNKIIKLIFHILIFLFIIPPIFSSYITNQLLQKDDTRIQAIKWYENQSIYPKHKIKIINLMRNVQFNSNKLSILEKKKLNENSLNSQERYKLSLEDTKNSYYSLNLDEPERISLLNDNKNFFNYIRKNKYNIIFTSYFSSDKKPNFLNDKNKNLELIKTIKPTNIQIEIPNLRSRKLVYFFPINFVNFNSFGPIVEIYEVKKLSNDNRSK